MLDTDDKKTIDKISFEQVFQALQDVIFPKFEELDHKIDSVKDELKEEMGEMKERIGELKIMSEILDRDMTGVKMRLGEVEKKVETLIDSSIEVKLHDRRISKLEAAI